MKHLHLLLLAGLLLATPVSPLGAQPNTTFLGGGNTLTDAVTRRVLDAAAAPFGTTSAILYAEYQSGLVIIADLGPIRNGRRYGVTRGKDYIIIQDIVPK